MADDLALGPGRTTSEFQVSASSSTWGIVALVLGLIVTIGSTVANSLGQNTTAGIIVGAVISCLGIIQKTLTDLGYISSRTQVKAKIAGNQ